MYEHISQRYCATPDLAFVMTQSLMNRLAGHADEVDEKSTTNENRRKEFHRQ